MVKIGIFFDKLDERNYTVVASSADGKGERIELYKNKEDFNPLDTYNAVSAYYRKVKESYFGDEDLIRRYLSVYNRCLSIKGEIREEFAVDERGIVLTQEKSNEALGLYYKIETINGIVAREHYVSKEYEIEIESSSDDLKDVFIVPINISQYKVVSILAGFQDNDVDDVDYYSLSVLKSRYPLEHLDDYDYIIVEGEDEARKELHEWRDAPVKIKALDIESTGLEVCIHGADRITGVVLAYDWGDGVEKSVYFPFRQKKFEYNLPIEFLKEISDATFAQPKDVIVTGHNIKMEIKSFLRDGLPLHMTHDTYTLSTLIHTRMERGLHTLKNIVKTCTNLFWLSLENIFKDKVIRFDVLPPDLVKAYALADGPNSIRAYKYLIQQLPSSEMSVYMRNCRLQYEKAQSEYYGMRYQQDKFTKALQNTEYMCNYLANEFKKIHRTSENINSPAVLRNIIYGQLGCEVLVYTEKGLPSTSAIAVSAIVDNSKVKLKEGVRVPDSIVDLNGEEVIKGENLIANKYPSLVILQAYNKKKKELGALNRIKKKSLGDRVMFGINGTGAASGRQTSDAHQYSSTMKSIIVADTPWHRFVSADFATVELRVLAYLIKDKRLLEMMADKHIDIHRAFLSNITGKPIYLITADERKKGKPVNFGVVYGISEYGLVRQQKGAAYTKDDLLVYTKYITDFHIGIPGVMKFTKANHEFVMEHGYIKTEFGYRRMFPEVFREGLTKKEIGTIKRGANNTPVQGFAADILKQSENNFGEYIKEKGWDKREIEYDGEMYPLVRVMLSVHDEVLVSAHQSIPAEEIIIMCQKCMEIDIEGAPPFFAVPAFADTWLDSKQGHNEMSIAMRDDVLEAYYKGEYLVKDWDNPAPYIKEYKLNVIKSYMEDLVSKYKVKEEIIPHVTHPEYTHLLIECYIDTKKFSSSTQEEYIAMAVEAYLNEAEVIMETPKIREIDEDRLLSEDYNYLEHLEEYIEIDEHGEALIIDKSIIEDEDDLTDLIDKQYSSNVSNFTDSNSDFAIYASDTVLIDTTGIDDIKSLQEMHQEITKLCEPDGYYRVMYMRGSNVLDSGVSMYPKQKDLDNILRKYLSKGDNIECQTKAI